MSKTFRPYEPAQISLMPASTRDWLPSDHLAYFISDIVDNLDLSAIMERCIYHWGCLTNFIRPHWI